MDSETGSPFKFNDTGAQAQGYSQANYKLNNEALQKKLSEVKILDGSTRASLAQNRASKILGAQMTAEENFNIDLKQADLLKDSFKHELDDFVQNSPLKESILSCRSKTGHFQFDRFFQK